MKTTWIIATAILAILAPRSYQVAPSASLVLKTPQNAISAPRAPIEIAAVENYAIKEAKIYGINPTDILWILSKESQDCQNLIGDDGKSRGCMMIDSVYHPEVSRACAMNLQCSLQWSLNFMAKNPNNIMQWSTYACKYAWFYKDAVKTFGLPPENYRTPPQCKIK